MYKTNKERYKSLILAFSDTRRLYKLMHLFIYSLIVFSIAIIIVYQLSYLKQKETINALFGRWNTVFVDVDEDDISYFENHVFIKAYSVQKVFRKESSKDNQRVVIGSCDDNFFDIGKITLLYGTLPKNEKEVAIEEEYLNLFGVSKVGDIIKNNSTAPVLEGYRVCGILRNYSSRWKMVNWDVDYINCFIADTSNLEKINLTCFVQSYDIYNNDITTNFINYRNNVNVSNTVLDKVLVYYWVCILLFCLLLKKLIMIKIKFFKKKKDIATSKNKRKLLKIAIVLLLFLNIVYLIILFFNKLVVYDTSMFDLQLNENRGGYSDYMPIIDDRGYIKYLTNNDVSNEKIKIVKYIPNKMAVNAVNIVMILFLIIMSNVMIYNYCVLCLNDEKDNNYYILNKYFYGTSIIKSEKIKRSLYIIAGSSIVFYTLLFFIRKTSMAYTKNIFIVYTSGIVIIIFIILVQYSLLRKYCLHRLL